MICEDRTRQRERDAGGRMALHHGLAFVVTQVLEVSWEPYE